MPDKERGGAAKVGATKGGATKGGATKGGAKGVERKPSTYMDKVQVQCPCTLDSMMILTFDTKILCPSLCAG